jgi:hypothetical protein
VRFLVAGLSALCGIDALRENVERGEIDGPAVAPWRAALLRARVESSSGAVELRRLTQRRAE